MSCNSYGETPICIVLCEESSYDLTKCFKHFSAILRPWHFYNVEFTYTSSPRKTARKITKILQSFGFKQILNRSNL